MYIRCVQVQYAALDAYCLLQLLDKWVAATPPALYPMYSGAVELAKPAAQPAARPSDDVTLPPLDSAQQSEADQQEAASGTARHDSEPAGECPRSQSAQPPDSSRDTAGGCVQIVAAASDRAEAVDEAALTESLQALSLSGPEAQLPAQQQLPASTAPEASGAAAGSSDPQRRGSAADSECISRQGLISATGGEAAMSRAGQCSKDDSAAENPAAAPTSRAAAEDTAGDMASEIQEGIHQVLLHWSCRLELLNR